MSTWLKLNRPGVVARFTKPHRTASSSACTRVELSSSEAARKSSVSKSRPISEAMLKTRLA